MHYLVWNNRYLELERELKKKQVNQCRGECVHCVSEWDLTKKSIDSFHFPLSIACKLCAFRFVETD